MVDEQPYTAAPRAAHESPLNPTRALPRKVDAGACRIVSVSAHPPIPTTGNRGKRACPRIPATSIGMRMPYHSRCGPQDKTCAPSFFCQEPKGETCAPAFSCHLGRQPGEKGWVRTVLAPARIVRQHQRNSRWFRRSLLLIPCSDSQASTRFAALGFVLSGSATCRIVSGMLV